MPSKPTRHNLEALEEDVAFQRRFWIVQRASWLGFAIVLAIALLGLTGSGGPWSTLRAESAFGVIEYPRVARWQAEEQMRIELRPAAGQQAEIELDRKFADLFEITSIQPEPAAARLTATGLIYTFDVERGGAVVFRLRAARPALGEATAVRVESAETRFRTIVLP